MFQCVIFDVDGTLIDTEIAVKKSLQKVLLEEGQKKYSWDELDFILGIPGHTALERLGIKDVIRVNRQWNIYMKDYQHHIKVFDGIEEKLKELRVKNIITGIVTSKTKKELEDDFIPFGLMKYLDFCVCASDTEKHKPFPDPILKFLEISGISNDQAVYIGDTVYDYQAATAANVKFALALWGAKNHNGINAFKKISSPDNILNELILL
jgi:HAD superfamily hydrolase (TIGR01549 family)